jgi:hypothetical protein
MFYYEKPIPVFRRFSFLAQKAKKSQKLNFLVSYINSMFPNF